MPAAVAAVPCQPRKDRRRVCSACWTSDFACHSTPNTTLAWVERCVLLGLGTLYMELPAAHLPPKGRLSRAQQLTARHHWCLLHQQLGLRTAAGQLTTAAPAARVLLSECD
jgi:hypothetical protein